MLSGYRIYCRAGGRELRSCALYSCAGTAAAAAKLEYYYTVAVLLHVLRSDVVELLYSTQFTIHDGSRKKRKTVNQSNNQNKMTH